MNLARCHRLLGKIIVAIKLPLGFFILSSALLWFVVVVFFFRVKDF